MFNDSKHLQGMPKYCHGKVFFLNNFCNILRSEVEILNISRIYTESFTLAIPRWLNLMESFKSTLDHFLLFYVILIQISHFHNKSKQRTYVNSPTLKSARERKINHTHEITAYFALIS